MSLRGVVQRSAAPLRRAWLLLLLELCGAGVGAPGAPTPARTMTMTAAGGPTVVVAP